MTGASTVVLVPPEAWEEERLLAAARSVEPPTGALRPGDAIGDLVVVRVEPQTGLAADADTRFEVRARPRLSEGAPHVALLVDTSESMGLPWGAGLARLDAARDAMLAFLGDSAQDVSAATVFTFARDARVLSGPFVPSKLKRAKIEFPAPGGPARLAEAIDAALAHLAAQSDAAAQTLVVLTDGADEPGRLRRAGERASRLGVPVHVVTFAPEMDDAFHALADATGGSVQRASPPPRFRIPLSTRSSA